MHDERVTPPVVRRDVKPDNLDEIERLALAATQGPWIVQPRYCGRVTTEGGEDGGGRDVALVQNTRQGDRRAADQRDANAAFIDAANPVAILALVAEVRRLRKVEAAARDAVVAEGPLADDAWDAMIAALTGAGGGT